MSETSHVTAPQGVSVRGVVGGGTSSVRLVELGPRMTLKLVKVEEGLLDGKSCTMSLSKKQTKKRKLSEKEGKNSRRKRNREKEIKRRMYRRKKKRKLITKLEV